MANYIKNSGTDQSEKDVNYHIHNVYSFTKVEREFWVFINGRQKLTLSQKRNPDTWFILASEIRVMVKLHSLSKPTVNFRFSHQQIDHPRMKT